MKPIVIFSHIFASFFLLSILATAGSATFVYSATPCVAEGNAGIAGSCTDGMDNDGDCRADWAGVKKGNEVLPPDPACVTKESKEYADDVESTIIPCTNKCDLGSVFEFINNIIEFLIKVIMFPVSVIMFMYAGYKYITAQGNPSKKADVKKMAWHLIGGIVIILCAWVVVKTLLVVIGYEDNLFFFE